MKGLNQSEWKPVEGYGEYARCRYEVDTTGQVRRIDGSFPHRSPDKDGYFRVSIRIAPKKYKTVKIHRLVALAFIPNPTGKPCVDHIDSDRQNNNVSNLRWATVAENNGTDHVRGIRRAKWLSSDNPSNKRKGTDAVWFGRHHTEATKRLISMKNKGRKRTAEQVEALRQFNTGRRNIACYKKIKQYTVNGDFVRAWDCIRDAEIALVGHSSGMVSRCLRGKAPSAYGFRWEYA